MIFKGIKERHNKKQQRNANYHHAFMNIMNGNIKFVHMNSIETDENDIYAYFTKFDKYLKLSFDNLNEKEWTCFKMCCPDGKVNMPLNVLNSCHSIEEKAYMIMLAVENCKEASSYDEYCRLLSYVY